MRKNIFVFVVLMSYPALAQISSGTSIIVNLTKDELVVAADSRTVYVETGVPDDSNCKIAAFRRQLVFVSAGGSHIIGTTTGLGDIEGWDNVELARDAVRNVPEAETSDAYIKAIADHWANAVVEHWNSLCSKYPLTCMKEAEINKGQFTSALFFGAKGLLTRGVAIYPSNMITFTPATYATGKELSGCSLCGQKHGNEIYAAGSHLDVAVNFCSKRKHGDKIDVRTPLKGRPSESTKLAVKIVELTIDAYEKTAGDVGGKVDAITLTKDGSMTWNSLKHDCPENQE